ncbi:MAG: restriction endonuclease subunit S [Runella sp.]
MPPPSIDYPPIQPEEVPFDIPDNWVWCRLGEIANHSLGKMLDVNKNKGEFKPYLRNINVQWFNFDLTDVKQMKFLESETEKYGAIKGDILICEGGYPGRAAIWDEDGVVMFQKALHRVRFINQCFNENLFVYYLYYINGGDFFRSYLTGSGIQHFTGKKLNVLPIPLPPLSEQKRIVAEIEKQLAKTKQLKELVLANQVATEQLLKALLHQAFEVNETD